jgi:ribonuclease HII
LYANLAIIIIDYKEGIFMDINNLIEAMPKLSFSNIKKIVDDINLEVNKESMDILKYLSKNLKDDSRKNVIGLGEKIEKQINKYNDEILRVKDLYSFDKSFGEYRYIAGVDEVGRGPLAGPIVAAAVILDLDCMKDEDFILYINDSKKLSEDLRVKLSYLIKEKALSYSIFEMSHEEIDNRGIAYCNNEVLKQAAYNLNIKPELVLSDGYAIKNFNIKNEFVIKGDSKSAAIACASIIAKVYRDNLMKSYEELYPGYGFSKHVGYGTKEHMENIRKLGFSPIHRKSFLTNI